MTAQEVQPTTGTSTRSPSRSAIGQFTWDTVADVWWWSDGLYHLYGYQPSSVEPTLERFLQHKVKRPRFDAAPV